MGSFFLGVNFYSYVRLLAGFCLDWFNPMLHLGDASCPDIWLAGGWWDDGNDILFLHCFSRDVSTPQYMVYFTPTLHCPAGCSDNAHVSVLPNWLLVPWLIPCSHRLHTGGSYILKIMWRMMYFNANNYEAGEWDWGVYITTKTLYNLS